MISIFDSIIILLSFIIILIFWFPPCISDMWPDKVLTMDGKNNEDDSEGENRVGGDEVLDVNELIMDYCGNVFHSSNVSSNASSITDVDLKQPIVHVKAGKDDIQGSEIDDKNVESLKEDKVVNPLHFILVDDVAMNRRMVGMYICSLILLLACYAI